MDSRNTEHDVRGGVFRCRVFAFAMRLTRTIFTRPFTFRTPTFDIMKSLEDKTCTYTGPQ